MKCSIPQPDKLPYIDFHTHSVQPEPEVLKIVSLEPEDFAELPASGSNCLFSIGLHPWRLSQNEQLFNKRLKLLQSQLRHPQVIAVGEFGLDRLKGPNLDFQLKCSGKLLATARQINIPVIIHCVKCIPEFIKMRKELAPELPVMIHGFNSKAQLLQQLLKHNCYVSLSLKALKREDICSCLTTSSSYINQIGLETDDSGANIKRVYARAAEVLNIEKNRLQQIMRQNFLMLFHSSKN